MSLPVSWMEPSKYFWWPHKSSPTHLASEREQTKKKTPLALWQTFLRLPGYEHHSLDSLLLPFCLCCGPECWMLLWVPRLQSSSPTWSWCCLPHSCYGVTPASDSCHSILSHHSRWIYGYPTGPRASSNLEWAGSHKVGLLSSPMLCCCCYLFKGRRTAPALTALFSRPSLTPIHSRVCDDSQSLSDYNLRCWFSPMRP